MKTFPILYSFRRCPYAMRARMAILYSGQKVLLREIALKNKPLSMLNYSEKGTVPVLALPFGRVLDESLDIMFWAIERNDVDNWFCADSSFSKDQQLTLIHENDTVFKGWLDKYKYADRFPEKPSSYYLQQAEDFILRLENCLSKNEFLMGESLSLVDVAIMPFIRQFAYVDIKWFEQSCYVRVRAWLTSLMKSDLFEGVMQKHMPWQDGDDVCFFPD